MNEQKVITGADADEAKIYLTLHPNKYRLPKAEWRRWDDAFNINEYAIKQGWFNKEEKNNEQ